MMIESPVEQYLTDIRIPIRLSCLDTSGWPVVLSLWYLYEGGAIYCATPKTARTAAYLRGEPRCAYEIASDRPPYCGVRGRAVATIVPEQGLEILERLIVRYLGSADNQLGQKLLSRTKPEVAIRLEPQTLHKWNFTQRMQDSVAHAEPKLCPDMN